MLTIAWKELREYLLKPGSLSWGIMFPLVFTLAFIVRFGDVDHLAPGLVVISLLFSTTSFVSSSVIFERRLRTFERLLVAPVSYMEIVWAKVLVGTLFGLFVGGVTILLLRQFMVYLEWNVPLLAASVILSGATFSALALFIALIPKNPIEAMTWLNLLRLPMMFTSGAIASLLLFPRWFIGVGLATPATYAVEAVRYSMLAYSEVVNPVYSLMVLTILLLLFIYLSIRALKSLY
ncbi:ABC transporter permease [Palaeococcus ferrophilus]|uniref:ABC transporter permease n=1 Tax=Palaeococcus ferrophilus TaxID=83868 RepID=UPI001FE0260C|nr:ABC transporter permease [Palaeococcus ferrophilus]